MSQGGGALRYADNRSTLIPAPFCICPHSGQIRPAGTQGGSFPDHLPGLLTELRFCTCGQIHESSPPQGPSGARRGSAVFSNMLIVPDPPRGRPAGGGGVPRTRCWYRTTKKFLAHTWRL